MCPDWPFHVRFLDQCTTRLCTILTLSRGAKAAMTVALRSPKLVSALIPVDNAPVNAALKSDFPKYVRGMQHVESAKVSKQSDADKILKDYEEVKHHSPFIKNIHHSQVLVYPVLELTRPVSSNPPIPSHQPRPRRGPDAQIPGSSLSAGRVA